MKQRKIIVTCAVTGAIHTPSMSPYLPISAREIEDAAVGAAEAGASIVHLHAREPETGRPSQDPELFRGFVGRIRGRSRVVSPCWSPDDRTFYFADTFQGEYWQYDYDIATGNLTHKRLFASFAADAGVADGSTVDAEGCLWNAQLISGDLVRYAPDGSVERRIGMPVRNITSVIFGGDELDEIYVTSMARVRHPAVHDHFAKELQPQFLAGSLFRITGLGIRGLPEVRFAG